MAKKRKYYSPDQKVQILKKHLVDRIPLSEFVTNTICIPLYFTGGKRPFSKMAPVHLKNAKTTPKSVLRKRLMPLNKSLQKSTKSSRS